MSMPVTTATAVGGVPYTGVMADEMVSLRVKCSIVLELLMSSISAVMVLAGAVVARRRRSDVREETHWLIASNG
jgi:hypothetical protein